MNLQDISPSVCYWIFLKLYNIFEISVQQMLKNLPFIYLFLWLLVSLLLYEERIQSLSPNSWRPSVMPWRSPFRHAEGTQKCPWSQNLWKARTIRWRKISLKKTLYVWSPLDHWLTEGISLCKITHHQHANILQKHWRMQLAAFSLS